MSHPSTPTTIPPSNHPAHTLLTKSHPDDPSLAAKIFTDKVAHKPLLLSASTDHLDPRTARRHHRLRRKKYALKHARPKPLSAKEKRALKLYDFEAGTCRYEVYQRVNALWKRYMLEVLGFVDREGEVLEGRVGTKCVPAGAGALIASADFHGMEVEVVRCVDTGRVGVRGIVVRETRSTLVVVCRERETSGRKLKELRRKKREREGEGEDSFDKVRMVLKKGTVFRVTLDLPGKDDREAKIEEDGEVVVENGEKSQRQLVFELHGSMLETRPPDRASKKFKFQWKLLDGV